MLRQLRAPLKIHFGDQANLLASGRLQAKAALASTKPGLFLPSAPENQNLLLAAQKQLLELPLIYSLVAVMFVFVSTSISAVNPISGQWTETAGLVAHWELDEDSGLTAYDSTAGSHDGTLRNMAGTEWTTDPTRGNVLSLNGGDDYVEMIGYKGISGGASRTCTAWIKTTLNGDILAWGDTSSAGERWHITIANNVLNVKVKSGSAVGSTTLTDGQWHHVAVVLDGGAGATTDDLRLYVDGDPETVTVVSQDIVTPDVNNVRIGIAPWSSSYFNGLIDDVRIYNRALNPINVITTNLSVSENGVSDIYSVVLAEIPSSTVTLKVYDTSDPNPDDADGESSGQLKFDGVDSKVLTFTTGDWDTPQNVTVTAIDDISTEINPHITSIGAIASQTTGGAEYDGLEGGFYEVTILENDCGAGPFSSMDFNQDCMVDFDDFIKFTEVWLDCSVDDSLGYCPEPPSLPEGVSMRFGVIADVHHTTVPHALPDITDRTTEIQNFTDDMNINLASFIIGTGDNIHDGSNGSVGSRYSNEIFTANVTTFKDSMTTFDGDVYYVFGNREARGTLDVSGFLAIWDDPAAQSHLPAGYYSFDYPGKDLRFIVLDAQYKTDGTRWEPLNIGYAVGHIPTVEQNWLSGELLEARNLGYEVYMFCHQQISDDNVYGLAPPSNYTEVVTILNSYNDIIRVVFGGHDHDGYMYLRNGINYVHVKDFKSDGNSWALVEVREDGSIFIDGHGLMGDFNIP